MKKQPSELAVLGGEPAFARKIHVGTPNIGDRALLQSLIDGALDRRWLSNNGELVQEFERQCASRLGVKHFIPMCNGTIALEIAIRALGLRGEVIVPSFTFIATAHALQWQEITPIFCDNDPQTHLIDPQSVEEAIGPNTTGIIGVHTWGQPCNVEALERIATKHGLTLIFDAAHAFGCSDGPTKIGNFGAAEVFSFHATKYVNTFEGGAVSTNDDDLAQRIRLMKNFGFAGYDNVVSIGTNGKMNEVSAAMGLTSLDSMDSFIKTNITNFKAYRKHLAGVPGVRLLEYAGEGQRNWQHVVLEINESGAGLTRDALMEVLWSENVLARRYFYPGCHRMEPYRSSSTPRVSLRNAELVSSRVLIMPTGSQLSEEAIATICSVIQLAVKHSDELASATKLTSAV